jgi:hypothetical protein
VRLRAYVFGALLGGAAIYPAFLETARDDFPLSTYPMFAGDRGKIARVVRAVAVVPGGEELRIPPELVSNSEAMQVVQTLQRTFRAGPEESERLCRAIADRLRARGDTALGRAERVELQSLEVDSVRYLGGEREPLLRRVHARCAVAQGS